MDYSNQYYLLRAHVHHLMKNALPLNALLVTSRVTNAVARLVLLVGVHI